VRDHYGNGIGRLDDLIRYLEIKMERNDPYNDNLYLEELLRLLECIWLRYGNIRTVASYLLMGNFNDRKFNYKEDNKWNEKKKKIAEHFEEMERLYTHSKKRHLISLEYVDKDPVLIVGAPDGLNFEGNTNKVARIYEIKTQDVFYTIRSYEGFIKKISDKIRLASNQLQLYKYILDRTAGFGLIGKIVRVELHGTLYFHSEDEEYLYSAKRIIRQNLNRIIRDADKDNAYNLSFKEEGKTYINGENLYYFKISFRVRYDERVVKNYLKNLDKLFMSIGIGG